MKTKYRIKTVDEYDRKDAAEANALHIQLEDDEKVGLFYNADEPVMRWSVIVFEPIPEK